MLASKRSASARSLNNFASSAMVALVYRFASHMEPFMTDDTYQPNAVELATELTIAWLSNPNTRTSADNVPAFLSQMHASVQSLFGGSQPAKTSAKRRRSMSAQ